MLDRSRGPGMEDAVQIDPEAAGFDAARLERITHHIRTRYVDAGRIHGCQVTVARGGNIAYFRSFGTADAERGTPVAEDTIWRIYSMTKPVTAVALMALYEEGRFGLGDPVHRFIPEWREQRVYDEATGGTVEPKTPVTVRDVLMHMSGLSYGGDQAHPADREYAQVRDPSADLELFCKKLAAVPLRFHPGTRWLYGYSTDVCGRLVEVLSGKRFDEFLSERIFEPLGMSDTAFCVRDADLPRFAANYGRAPDKSLRLIDDPHRSTYRRPPAMLSGGGGLVSTSADYLKFCEMLRRGGSPVLGSRTLRLMTQNHLPGGAELQSLAVGYGGETGFEGVGFGLGMAVGLGAVAQQAIGSAGEFYWGGAASTIFWVDPAEDLVVIFMTQLMPSGTFNFRGQLKTLVYPAIAE